LNQQIEKHIIFQLILPVSMPPNMVMASYPSEDYSVMINFDEYLNHAWLNQSSSNFKVSDVFLKRSLHNEIQRQDDQAEESKRYHESEDGESNIYVVSTLNHTSTVSNDSTYGGDSQDSNNNNGALCPFTTMSTSTPQSNAYVKPPKVTSKRKSKKIFELINHSMNNDNYLAHCLILDSNTSNHHQNNHLSEKLISLGESEKISSPPILVQKARRGRKPRSIIPELPTIPYSRENLKRKKVAYVNVLDDRIIGISH